MRCVAYNKNPNNDTHRVFHPSQSQCPPGSHADSHAPPSSSLRCGDGDRAPRQATTGLPGDSGPSTPATSMSSPVHATPPGGEDISGGVAVPCARVPDTAVACGTAEAAAAVGATAEAAAVAVAEVVHGAAGGATLAVAPTAAEAAVVVGGEADPSTPHMGTEEGGDSRTTAPPGRPRPTAPPHVGPPRLGMPSDARPPPEGAPLPRAPSPSPSPSPGLEPVTPTPLPRAPRAPNPTPPTAPPALPPPTARPTAMEVGA